MQITAFSRGYLWLATVAAITAIVLALAIAVPALGIRPYGEQALLEQINREDGVVCDKFGFRGETPQFADCMLVLADLRQHHADLLISLSWL